MQSPGSWEDDPDETSGSEYQYNESDESTGGKLEFSSISRLSCCCWRRITKLTVFILQRTI